MKRRLAAAALLPLALTAAAKKGGPLDGRVAGAPVECIDPHFTDGPAIWDEHHVIYNGAGTTYLNTPIGDCPGMEPTATIIIENWGGQSCRNDRFRVRRLGEIIPGPICRLGQFVPYRRPGSKANGADR
jgi:hypothetical protein